jgi:Zn-dependent peptidase ImmA (M78 family)
MTKSDDSSLSPDSLRSVEARARQLLDRSSAWDRYPTPVDDILHEAKLKVALTSAFSPAAILSYIEQKTVSVGKSIKSALSKVFGIYDPEEFLIHIDETVVKPKQTFLKLHEAGHHEMPTHRKIFRLFQECEKTLAPEIADLFEREANNFARYVLFQGDGYARLAADCNMSIHTPMKLSKKFGASVYAAAREFARTNRRACVLYVLEPIQYVDGVGAQAAVRRIEPSPDFEKQFGRPTDTVITMDHDLGCLLPIGRKMSRPTTLSMTDLNGTAYECLAEAFDTTHNVLILLYPVAAVTRTTVILSAPGKATPGPANDISKAS